MFTLNSLWVSSDFWFRNDYACFKPCIRNAEFPWIIFARSFCQDRICIWKSDPVLWGACPFFWLLQKQINRHLFSHGKQVSWISHFLGFPSLFWRKMVARWMRYSQTQNSPSDHPSLWRSHSVGPPPSRPPSVRASHHNSTGRGEKRHFLVTAEISGTWEMLRGCRD